MKAKILNVYAKEILDSRGNPTVEVEITAKINNLINLKIIKAWSEVPSGASTGKYEAFELRDGDKIRFGGKGVLKAVENINTVIAEAIKGKNPLEQENIDNILLNLDGTANKKRLGANAILAVSMAVARLGAIIKKQPLYQYIAELSDNKKIFVSRPFFNVLNGGVHAGNEMAFQEFMISPNLGSYDLNYRAGAEIYQQLKKDLKQKFGGEATLLGDEGGFAPGGINDPKEALDLLMEAIEKIGYKNKVDIALDVAASEFFENGKYNLGIKSEEDNYKSVEEMIQLYSEIVQKYPIISIEDPFEENDFLSFAKLKEKFSDKKIQIVGDDLTVTNPSRIKEAILKESCNALLLKLNQIGTITESITAFNIAKSAGWNVMVSHRSGETIDDFIADFAVGVGAEQIKSGAPARGERIAKYNRLLNIFNNIKNI